MTYSPLDDGLPFSTVNLGGGPTVLALWSLILSSKDREGIASMTPEAAWSLWQNSREPRPLEDVKAAWEYLASPDPKSRNREQDGRRITPTDDGRWFVVSSEKYREKYKLDRRRVQVLEAKRRQREREAEQLFPISNDVDTVFRRWQERLGHPEAKLTPKREKLIRERLEDSTVDELLLAIDGCKSSEFHQGENESGKVYDDIALICRDREHVEQFMREARPGGSKPEPDSPEAIEAEKEQWRREAEERAAQRERERAEALAMPYADELPK